MQNQLRIYIVFRGTGSSETYWVVVLLVAPFPSVGHGQAHVSEASSLVLVVQEPSAEFWLRSAAVGGHPSPGRRQAAPQSRRREKSSPKIPQAELQARSPHRLAQDGSSRGQAQGPLALSPCAPRATKDFLLGLMCAVPDNWICSLAVHCLPATRRCDPHPVCKKNQNRFPPTVHCPNQGK